MSLAESSVLSCASSAPLLLAHRVSNAAVVRSHACCWRCPTGKMGRLARNLFSAFWVGKQLMVVLCPYPRMSNEMMSYRARTGAGSPR